MSHKTYKISAFVALVLTTPILVWAFPNDLTGVIEMFTNIAAEIIPFLAALAFLFFVYGVAKFIKSAGSEKEIKDSKNILVWGIVGLFVLVTIWGIIAFLQSDFGFGSGDPFIPQVKLDKLPKK